MGGKAKSSQRTKNNVRPSSSGRSAELLNNAVNLDSSFISGGKMMSALFPTLATPVLDQGIPVEFTICIKKLNKKDPITKVKALQELSELVASSKVDDVVLVLPSWAHYYKILGVDTDCKVREMAQMCHGAFARSCGRRLAVVLRQVVPAWLQAQYDEHAPAAAYAAHALQATFPENKLPEVISFCKAEVMAHLMDTLVGNAQKTLIKPAEEAEERELQLQRLVISSLQGLQYFCQHLPAAQHSWLWQQLQPLLAAPTFWKYATHPSPQLRVAWWGGMSRVVERFASTFAAQFGARLVKLLLGAPAPAPPALAPQLWGCWLQLMHSVPDWHVHLDRKDLLTKRMLDMIEKGGWGDARRLTDMLLPLLAHLPQEMISKQFYETFFDSFFKGLEKKSILTSKSERQYWIASIAECLRYLSIQRYDFVVEVTTAVHRNWLEIVLSTEREGQLKTNLIKHSASNMASLVKFWLKQSKGEKGERYDQSIRNFWQNVCSTVLNQIENEKSADITQVVEGHILLLQTLKIAFSSDGKKAQSIKFDGDAPNQTEARLPSQEVDAAALQRYNHNLNEVVEKICCDYFEYADKNDVSDVILTPLITILNEFDSKNLYAALAKHFSATDIHDFYDKVLKKWMLRDTMRSKTIVDITFSLMKHLNEKEQEAVLDTFDEMGCPVMEWGVGAALTHRMWGVGAARRWLHSAPGVRATLLRAARRLRAHPLLLVCLSADAGGEMLISEETASEIAEVVSDALCSRLDAWEARSVSQLDLEPDLDLEHVAGVASHLVTALAARTCSAGYRRLVRDLFQLLLRVPVGRGALSAGGWREARGAAHDGLCALQPPHRARLAALLPQRLALLVNEVDVPQIEHMTSLTPCLLSGRSSEDEVREVVELTKLLLEWEWEPAVEMAAVRHECVVGRFNCPFHDDDRIIRAVVEDAAAADPVELTKETLVPSVNRVLFRALYLKTMLLHATTDEEEDGKERDGRCDMLLSDDYLQMEFCKLLREFMVVRSLEEAYGFWLHHDIIREAKIKLGAVVDDIIGATGVPTRDKILSRLLELAAAEGFFWASARRLYEVKVEGGNTLDNKLDGNAASAVDDGAADDLDDDLDEDRPPDLIQDDIEDAELKTNGDEDLARNARVAPNSDVEEDRMIHKISGKGYYHCLQANCEWGGTDRQIMTSRFSAAVRSVLVGFPAAAEDAGANETAISAALAHDLSLFVELYHRLDPAMLCEKDITKMSWAEVVAEVAIIDCTVSVLQQTGWEAPQHHWDFATVTLCALIDNLCKASAHLHNTKVALVGRAALAMYVWVGGWVRGVGREMERRAPSAHVAALPAEWRDVFAPALHRSLYTLAVNILESSSKTMTYNKSRIVIGLSRAIRHADWNLIDSAHKNSSLRLSTLVDKCGQALARPLHPLVHCLAHATLTALATPLAEHDAEKISSWSVEGPDANSVRPTLAPDWFQPHLTRALQLTDEVLSPYTAGLESCVMEAGSDSHGLALGALLLADALHDLCSRAHSGLPHHYTQMYREARYVETLLPVALRLLPAALLAAPHPPPHYRHMFYAPPAIDADEGRWSGAVEHLACRGVWTSVGGAGGCAARGWWGAAGRAGAPLARLVRAYVAPRLIAAQLATLRTLRSLRPELEVRALAAAREVVAELAVEERRVTLLLHFAPEHPLHPPRVSVPRPAPSAALNVAWVPVYIAYQNGTVANAIKMWSSAISSHVESSPQCYICYCRLHPTTGQLPNVPCHQCRNRFHTPCLHKWFASSHRSNCPLCRSSF